MHPEEVYCRSRPWCKVTHLPRKLNTSSWAPDDDQYWCQKGLLPTKCLVWQAQCQLIKSHARTVTVSEEQGVLFFLTPPLPLFLLALRHWCHRGLVWTPWYQTSIPFLWGILIDHHRQNINLIFIKCFVFNKNVLLVGSVINKKNINHHRNKTDNIRAVMIH